MGGVTSLSSSDKGSLTTTLGKGDTTENWNRRTTFVNPSTFL